MTNNMTIRYETVKYYTGYVGGNQPSSTTVGFADPNHYDVSRSGIGRPGSQATVFGQGGIVDAGIGVLEDLNAVLTGQGGLQNILGGVQKGAVFQEIARQPGGWTAVEKAATAEWRQAYPQIVQAGAGAGARQVLNAANGVIFPKAPNNPTTNRTLGTGVGAGVFGPNSRIGF